MDAQNKVITLHKLKLKLRTFPTFSNLVNLSVRFAIGWLFHHLFAKYPKDHWFCQWWDITLPYSKTNHGSTSRSNQALAGILLELQISWEVPNRLGSRDRFLGRVMYFLNRHTFVDEISFYGRGRWDFKCLKFWIKNSNWFVARSIV